MYIYIYIYIYTTFLKKHTKLAYKISIDRQIDR